MKRAALLAALLGAQPLATAGLAADKPLFVYVTPNPLGVNDFLKLGKVGTERAAQELGGEAKTYESSDPTTQRQNLEAAAKAGARIVIAIGFEFNDMLPEVAAAYPKVEFLQIDSCPFQKMKPNIHCAVFREYEGSYLTGAEAGWTTKTGKVGAISALDIPFLHRYTDGFVEGAKHAKPDVKISPTLWIGGTPVTAFSDPARGQERGAAMVADGADRILAAGAGSNGGIFKAMQDAVGAEAFGVDVNQCPQAPGVVMDNVEKKTNVAVESAIKGIMAGSEPPIATLGLKEGGMSVVALDPDVKASKCTIADYPDVIEKVKALRDEIVNGSIKIADPMMAK
ncbi:MAG: BMP family ABC transporter substrate-binding protein [Hyphomicrobiales bacterium]|nr:BMP family ABC transporter substrate-binding protein [Hyphomicrobiales bacterium]